MSVIFMFGTLEIRKINPMEVNQKGNRNLFVSSIEPTIVRSQHDYFFVPTTQPQIII